MVARAHDSRKQHGRDTDRDLDRERDEDAELAPGKLTRTAANERPIDGTASRFGDMAKLRTTLAKLGGGGTPLPSSVAAKYSALLGADLSAVRIHTTGDASHAAAAMGARALTHGAHIAFAPGAYVDANAEHDHVLAHELVHVVQNQRSGGEAMQLAARLDVGPSNSAIENEAEAGAAALTSGRSFVVSARSSLPGISLLTDPGPAPNQSVPPPAEPNQSVQPPAGPNQSVQPPAGPNQSVPPPAGAPAPGGATSAPSSDVNGTPDPNAAPAAKPAPTGTPSGGTPDLAGPGGPTGPVAPGGAKNETTSPAAAPGGAIDSKVAAILEKRADPKARADYTKTMFAFSTLRLQATQYTFVNSNIGHTLLQMVWPSDALSDHVGQVGKLNQYRGEDPGGGVSFAGGLQRCIESLRGVLHIIGDLAAALSAIAGVVAIASSAVAAVCAISIIGLAGPAEVAAAIAVIADAIATAAALVKIAADIIDMILGLVQMIILVIRARAAKGDPEARARFAMLLRKEAGDFASNVVGVVVQVGVLLATAGAGAGGAKGLMKMTMKDVATEFEKLLPRAALKSLKEDLPAGMKLITKGIRDTKAGAKIGKAGSVRPGVGPGSKAVALTAEEEMAKLSVIVRNGKNAAKKVPGGNGEKMRKLVSIGVDPAKRGTFTILNTAKIKYIGIKNVGAISAAGTTAQITVITKAPSSSGSGPSGSGGSPVQPGTPLAGSLATVQMWPSQIDAFKTEQNLIPNAAEHVEEQYENAKTQAGPELAALWDTKLKAAIEKRAAAKEEGSAVKADAADGKAQSEKGGDTAKQGGDAKKKGDANNEKIKDKSSTIDSKSGSLKTPPASDSNNPLTWAYNHSLGYLGQALGYVTSGIKNNLGKFLFYLAGYDSAELDFAGIEGDMRTAAQSDTMAGEKAGEASAAVDPVQQAVVDMQTDKTESQQQAIQGMADAMNFLKALEEAKKTLDEAIANGEAYMAAAAPILQHESETVEEEKPIDAAYVAPALAYADAVGASIDEDNGPSIAASAKQGFTSLGAQMPGLDISVGIAACDSAQTAHKTGHDALVTKAHAAAGQVKTALGAFIGTKDYEGVNANALTLDKLYEDMQTANIALDQQMIDAINGVIDQYNAAIATAFDNAQATDPTVPVPAPTGPPAPPPNTPDPTLPNPNLVPPKQDAAGDPPPPVNRKADGGGVSDDAQQAVQAAGGGGGGSALPGELRTRLEASLDADLSSVRVHTGASSQAAAKSVGAKAYATGHDIHFAEGEYNPQSPDGQHLIAHEVAHTVQQGAGRAAPGAPQHKLAVSSPGDAHEREADQFADAFVGGKTTVFSQLSTAGPMIARAPKAPNKVEPYSLDNFRQTTATVSKQGVVSAVEAIRSGNEVLVQTPGVSMVGKAVLKDDIDPAQPINVGWVQTVESSRRVSIYEKDGKVVRRQVTAFSSTRDGKRGVAAPWYEAPETITKDKRDVYPMAEDQPKMSVPNTMDGGTLTEIQGSDDFKVSLEAGVGTAVSPIKTFAWSAPWSVRLGSADSGRGGDVSVSESATHEGPKGTRTANEVGNDPNSTLKSYESEADAAKALASNITGFIKELPKHKAMLPESYWHMVAALWNSPKRFHVTITKIDGAPDVQVTFKGDFTVSLPESSYDADHSAIAHMVYDPGTLAPGKYVTILINGLSQASISFPFEPVHVADVKWDDYVYNIDVALR